MSSDISCTHRRHLSHCHMFVILHHTGDVEPRCKSEVCCLIGCARVFMVHGVLSVPDVVFRFVWANLSSSTVPLPRRHRESTRSTRQSTRPFDSRQSLTRFLEYSGVWVLFVSFKEEPEFLCVTPSLQPCPLLYLLQNVSFVIALPYQRSWQPQIWMAGRVIQSQTRIPT